ncbi:MAG: branched-chain amino acid aminotransferase [Clostridia bacterium]|nr:branched-chain amino acid aminotransferase [Clostridia bacterium]
MEIIRRSELKQKPAAGEQLGFGKYFTDYMFTMKYTAEKGWHDAKIEPNEPVKFDLATSVFHYAQGIFEGMKAFIQPDGNVAVFRPDENWARMNRSAERMCIPQFPADVVQEGLDELLKLEKDWIPRERGTALYIRPTIVATRVMLGVHASTEYLFFIILSPVGSYYAHGLEPTKLIAEDFFVRSAIGGTGEAKCLGNYAASMKAGELAEEKGFDQVLWLDAAEKKYVEEVGSMNMFFVLGGEVVTPALVGSILPGITRKSCLQILRERGYRVSERRISIDEVVAGAESGALTEAFGTGTAAVISPVGLIRYRDKDYVIGGGKMGEITKMLYDTVTGIQYGELPDEYGWRRTVK